MNHDRWNSVLLCDVATFASGKTPSRSRQSDYYDAGTIPWVKTMDLTNAGVLRTDERVTEHAVLEARLKVLPKGAVLVAMYGGFSQIGRTGVLRIPAATNQAITAVLPNSRLNSDYLLHFLNYNIRYWRTVASSSRKDPNITKADVKALSLTLPPPREQEVIASALNDIEDLTVALERMIAKKQAIKQGMMQQLLTGKTRLPGFSGAWEHRRVIEMGDVLAGKALNVGGAGSMRPYLRTKNVLDGRIDLEDVLWMPMTDLQFSRFRIEHGDVLLNEGQSLDLVGRCSIYNGEYGIPCAMQNQLLRFRARSETSPEFAAHLFRYCQRSGTFAGIATKTTSVAHLGSSRLASLRLIWPTERLEQVAIAKALSDIDFEIATYNARLDKASAIKQGMMQQLLTGRTRLLPRKAQDEQRRPT